MLVDQNIEQGHRVSNPALKIDPDTIPLAVDRSSWAVVRALAAPFSRYLGVKSTVGIEREHISPRFPINPLYWGIMPHG